MPAPAIPANEQQRLSELHALKILDTPPEERFDRIVRMARHLFRVPIAYIALIDADRQWFKSRAGLEPAQTTRAESFCGHAVLQSGPTIVPDARLDERFADNPMVLGEPHIRFYAGYPLAGPNGFNIGTICLVDREPRQLTESEIITLRFLAGLTEEQLKLTESLAAQQRLIQTQVELAKTQRRLSQELLEASQYIRSLLPRPLDEGPLQTRWEYVPSSTLGGDLFDYHWLDDDTLAIYLLDVCGHGVGASLLASTVHSALRQQGLDADFTHPGQVMRALDDTFPMDQHLGKFFTIWYGVYHRPTRRLRYATAGHPPALLFSPDRQSALPLGSPALMIGVSTDREDFEESLLIFAGSRLAIFSDGVLDAQGPDGGMLQSDGLERLLADAVPADQRSPAQVARVLREIRGQTTFEDDFSLLEVLFA